MFLQAKNENNDMWTMKDIEVMMVENKYLVWGRLLSYKDLS